MLAPDEVVALSVKYASKRIAEIPADEMPKHTKALLFRIHTITGWNLPDDDFFLNTLVSEFEKFLIENYSELNPDEISYAFRNYGTTVKDWGKSMNLSLIDEPIAKYLQVRKCLSDIEERKSHVIEINHGPIASDWKEQCEYHYQQYLKQKHNIELWAHEMYEEFVKSGYIEEGLYEDFTDRAQTYLVVKKQTEITDEGIGGREHILNKLNTELTSIQSGNEQKKIMQYAKRFAIQFLYGKAQEAGFKNLYVTE